MQRNPLYYFLQKTRSDLVPAESKKQKSYYRLPLGDGNKQHHLSIYQKYDLQNPYLTAIHYTKRDKDILHIFFDENCNYVCFDYRTNKTDDKLTLPEDDVIKHIQNVIEPELKKLALGFLSEQDKIRQDNLQCLSELDSISKLSTTSKTYIAHIEKSIGILQDCVNLNIDSRTNSSRRNFLTNYLARLNNRKKITSASPKIKKPAILLTEEISESKSFDTTENKENMNTPFSECPLDNITDFLKLNKKLDDLDYDRKNALLQACIDEDLIFLQKNYTTRFETHREFIGFLFSTAIYNNNLTIFTFLHEKVKNHYFKNEIFLLPVLSLSPNMTLASFESSLEIAYERTSIEFFRLMLNRYYYQPSSGETRELTLLIRTVIEGKNDYLSALLKAGANPNVLVLCTKSIVAENPLAVPRAKEYLDYPLESPLHYAVTFQNMEAIELLLRYQANPSGFNDQNVTPLGNILQIEPEKFNKKIITLLINANASIDERQTTDKLTLLFQACRDNKTEWVKILLEFNADPHVAHFTKTDDGYEYFTPLLLAELQESDKVVEELLNANLEKSHENLSRLKESHLVIKAKNRCELETTISALLNKIKIIKGELTESKVEPVKSSTAKLILSNIASPAPHSKEAPDSATYVPSDLLTYFSHFSTPKEEPVDKTKTADVPVTIPTCPQPSYSFGSG